MCPSLWMGFYVLRVHTKLFFCCCVCFMVAVVWMISRLWQMQSWLRRHWQKCSRCELLSLVLSSSGLGFRVLSSLLLPPLSSSSAVEPLWPPLLSSWLLLQQVSDLWSQPYSEGTTNGFTLLEFDQDFIEHCSSMLPATGEKCTLRLQETRGWWITRWWGSTWYRWSWRSEFHRPAVGRWWVHPWSWIGQKQNNCTRIVNCAFCRGRWQCRATGWRCCFDWEWGWTRSWATGNRNFPSNCAYARSRW